MRGVALAGCGGVLAPLLLIGCGAAPPAPGAADTYLRWVAFEEPVSNDRVLLRWPLERMPLRVYLADPPDGLFDDPQAIHDAVADGVADWAGVAGPGVPSFVFVERIGDADIPIVWAREPDGDWYIAHCAYDVDLRKRRFGVSRILVTGRGLEGRVADLHDVHRVLLHEMGHALGLAGHSPDPRDVMSVSAVPEVFEGLSARDRATLAALYARPIGFRMVGARVLHN